MCGSKKDREWINNPEFCIECGNERELNKHAVCQECWEDSPTGEHEGWEDTLV